MRYVPIMLQFENWNVIENRLRYGQGYKVQKGDCLYFFLNIYNLFNFFLLSYSKRGVVSHPIHPYPLKEGLNGVNR